MILYFRGDTLTDGVQDIRGLGLDEDRTHSFYQKWHRRVSATTAQLHERVETKKTKSGTGERERRDDKPVLLAHASHISYS